MVHVQGQCRRGVAGGETSAHLEDPGLDLWCGATTGERGEQSAGKRRARQYAFGRDERPDALVPAHPTGALELVEGTAYRDEAHVGEVGQLLVGGQADTGLQSLVGDVPVDQVHDLLVPQQPTVCRGDHPDLVMSMTIDHTHADLYTPSGSRS